jgi:hypothetical protein
MWNTAHSSGEGRRSRCRPWHGSCCQSLDSHVRGQGSVSGVPYLMSIFHCLGLTKVSVQVRGLLYECFVTRYVLTVRSC